MAQGFPAKYRLFWQKNKTVLQQKSCLQNACQTSTETAFSLITKTC
jgi:hypothetical protein